MGDVIRFRRRHHGCASHTSTAEKDGRGTLSGQSHPAGQWSENHCKVRSSRLTWISAPRSSAPSFLVSPNERQLTVDKSSPLFAAYARATMSSSSIPFIESLSVKLPRTSRVMLPHDKIFASGYPTAMKAKDNIRTELLNWIDDSLSTTRLSESAAEKRAGHASAIRNLRKGKSQSWQPHIFRAFIGIFGQPPAALMNAMLDTAPPSMANHTAPVQRMEAELEAIERRAEELRTAIRVWKQLDEPTG